jgi:hypothetical protein
VNTNASAPTRVIAIVVATTAFVVRFLEVGAIENDHYVYLARAHQILHGAWPVRDFADPGMPLGYLLSALAAAIAGPTLLTDVVVTVALFAIGAGATFVLVRRASGSITLGLLAVAVLLIVPPRLYNSSKMLVPIIAMVLAWRYADRPSTGRAAALGAWIGVAFLFRHDYALYVGLAAALFLFVQHWGAWKSLMAAVGTCAGIAIAVVAPWLIYVEVQQGLPEYLASAMRFSVAERDRTVAQWPLVFYAAAAIPVAALLVAWRGTRHLLASQVIFATVLVVASELVLLRDEPAARLPDVAAITAVAAAIIIGRFLTVRVRKPDTPPPILLASAIITVVGILLIIARTSIVSAVPEVATRWKQVSTRLHDGSPDIMPNPHLAVLVRFIERCSTPDERVLIGGFAPELPVLARRGFAGGLPDWIHGYYDHPDDVARARAQLAREHVALAVMLDGGDTFAAAWPAVADDLHAAGLTRYDLQLTSRPVEIWLRPTTILDGATHLPCGR